MIVFKKLRYMNILSTGNVFTEIQFNRSPSTLIVGENGAGKSTMIEALTFVLYGKPFRNINKPQLLNSITGKGLLVEIEFSIGKINYLIRRGMKPNLFEIYQNGKMLNQNAGMRDDQEFLEKQILKLNYKSFSQIVVLGSANYVPFMQLPAMQRRAVVEDLLDIQIFSVMNSLLKDKIGANKSTLYEVENRIMLVEQKIEMHSKHLNKMKANNDELINRKRIKMDEHQAAVHALEKEINDVVAEMEPLNEKVADHETVTKKRSKLTQMEDLLTDKARKLQKEISFFHDHDNCPTCKQGIDHDFKTTTIQERQAKTDEVSKALTDIEQEIHKVTERLSEIAEINNEISRLNKKYSDNNQQIAFYQRLINDLSEEIDELQNKTPDIDDDGVNESDELKQELKKLEDTREEISHHKAVLDVASVLLKDTGIKTKIIRQYVPIMNKLINKYLAAMDFFVNFELDESFSETIKSRHRDEFTYASFSEGEKLRIDLALMFTWRAIAKLRNSASTNLLIMDEVFDSSLDSAGTEEFLKILESLTQDTNTFIISHKGDQLADKFRSILRFEKHGNFSKIAA